MGFAPFNHEPTAIKPCRGYHSFRLARRHLSLATALKEFFRVEGAVRRILVLEKHEHILAIGQQLGDGRRNRLTFRRRVFRFSEPEIGEVCGRNFRDLELLGFRPAKSDVMLPEQVIDRVNQPGSVPELEGIADISRKAGKEVREELQIASQVRRELKEDWPEPVQRAFAHINPAIYVTMQGPSELGIASDAKLAKWERTDDLASIEVPTLVIGARYDTMDPAHMEMMASLLPHGRYLYCPNGSHLAMYDDQETYFAGLVEFLHSLAATRLANLTGLSSNPRD